MSRSTEAVLLWLAGFLIGVGVGFRIEKKVCGTANAAEKATTLTRDATP